MLTVVSALAVSVVAAQKHDHATTVAVLDPNFAFESEPCVLTKQHIGNIKSYVFRQGPSVMDTAVLHDGDYSASPTPEHGPASVKLAWVRPVQQSQLAVALFNWEWVGGSSSQSNVVQVFGCRDGHLTIIQQISNDAQSVHAGADYDAKTGVLIVKLVNYGAGAHCCPESLDVVSFRLTDKGFLPVGWKTIPMPK